MNNYKLNNNELQLIKQFINPKFLVKKNNYAMLGVLIILAPLFIFFILPLTIINYVYDMIFVKYLNNNTNIKNEIKQTIPDNELKNKDKRKFDIILFGSTGFTGKLALEYLIKNYITNNDKCLKLGLCSRDKAKCLKNLNLLLEKYKIIPKHNIEIFVSDASDYQKLLTIVKQTKAVVSTVGPFYQYGIPLVNCCAAAGTDYTDITGEFYFVQENIMKFDNLANTSGSRIVSFSGFDSMPFDTLLNYSENNKTNKNSKLKKFICYDYVKSQFSGGTLKTLINSIKYKIKKISLMGNDPIYKKLGSNDLFKNNVRFLYKNYPHYEDSIKGYTNLSPLAFGNFKIIKRSNVLNNYSDEFIYQEYSVYNTFVESAIVFLFSIYIGMSIYLDPLRYLLFKFNLLPSPGSGGDIKKLEKCYCDIIGVAYYDDNTKVISGIKFEKDPGYIETAKMVCEAALCFIYNNDKIDKRGGIHTTSSCFNMQLVERLNNANCIIKKIN